MFSAFFFNKPTVRKTETHHYNFYSTAQCGKAAKLHSVNSEMSSPNFEI